MIIYPAIDLQNGQCVRLYKGDMDQATIFNSSPATQALEFQNAGFKYLHVVDLDGAAAGSSQNEESIKEILDVVNIPIQLGGGIRTIECIKKWLDMGVSRIILGTAAAKDPELVREACKQFPGQIVVAIDAIHGMVAIEGWIETSEISALDLGKKYEDCGVSALIYTDISRDGTLSGVEIEDIDHLARNVKIPVVVSGGVSSMSDVHKISKLEGSGVVGMIVGRALYDKMVDASSLVALQEEKAAQKEQDA